MYLSLYPEYGIAIEKIEGEWFENLDWFLEHRVPIKKVVQAQGDAVVVGCGSLYWHKAKGKSLHCCWNIVPKSEKQVAVLITRVLNQKEHYQRGNKVPIKSILLRALNHEEYIL
jgi:hypothetical protein